ncbi:iron ABC transporter permease [Desulfovibrio aminophilus]|nr:iron ABC transporter permease [Desulfovibrio aminophilus]MCM0756288.1 iron ABC transporter permease [Desulfovibrio aminophilus]
MHFADGRIPGDYARYVGRKTLFIAALSLAAACSLALSLSLGAADLSLAAVVRTLAGAAESERARVILWNIRLPQSLAALAAGAGLALCGAAMQSILRNPLGSPFTLGISHAAAFGAALAVLVLGDGRLTAATGGAVVLSQPAIIVTSAFLFSLAAALVVVALARRRGSTPEVMVLGGVALGSLFTAGTMFLQYFADDVQLAAMVFWTFGDTARANWTQVGILAAAAVFALVYFTANAWNYNAVDAGDETARSLGVRLGRVRLCGMLAATLVTSVIISFLGVIGFVGLVTPHMVRRVIGADHRFLLPAAGAAGALLLLAADTAARLILAPHVLPVSVLTAFLGAPVFFLLILRRRS